MEFSNWTSIVRHLEELVEEAGGGGISGSGSSISGAIGKNIRASLWSSNASSSSELQNAATGSQLSTST